MKGTSYARKNKVNAQLFNNKNHYITIFQEFIQNKKLFIFDASLSNAVQHLGAQLQNQATPQDDLRMTIQDIKQAMIQSYAEIVEQQQLFPETTYIFPFSFKNKFNIRIIQIIPGRGYIHIVLDNQISTDPQIHGGFDSILEAFTYVMDIQTEPQIVPTVLQEETRQVLNTFDKQLPSLLILFAEHYEHKFEGTITIKQPTIQRFFYTAHPVQAFYDSIKNDEQKIVGFFDKLHEKYQNGDKIKITLVQFDTHDSQYQQKLSKSALIIKNQFLESKCQNYLALFQIMIVGQQDGEPIVTDKVAVYVSMEKASPKPIINYFIVSKDEQQQQNGTMIFDLIAEGDQNFEINVYLDYTRHNCLSQYSDWSLSLWAHVMTKRKLNSIQAMRAMTMAMTPYYLAFKQMD